MPDEPNTSARQRFARDLRRIREDREVSLASLHAETQVPESHLRAFEEGTLYDQSRMNAVYLKAFVRAYADAVGISPESVVQHLNSALEGTYQNELAVQHLNEPPAADEPDPASTSAPSDPSLGEEGGDQGSTEEKTDSDSSSLEGPARSSGAQKPSSPPGKSDATPASTATVQDTSAPHDSSGASSRGQGADRAHSRRSASAGVLEEYRGPIVTGAIGLVALAVVAGLIGIYFGGESPSSPSTSSPEDMSASRSEAVTAPDPIPSDSTPSTDSVSADTSPARRPPATLTLSDTLHVTLLATSVVREVRVQQDDDLRRPYWLEEGEALTFPFTERITVQNQLDSLQLYLEQYPYPTSTTDEEGRVLISRDTAQRFADTLRGAPASFSVRPDTVRINRPSLPEPDTAVGAPPG